MNSRLVCFHIFFTLGIFLSGIAQATDMAEMQKQLNQDVMDKPFSVAEESKIDAYIQNATKSGSKPAEYKGRNWQPGYTCGDLRAYSYYEYRDCRYYHNYYGHYYY